jgi:hypothetical protein
MQRPRITKKLAADLTVASSYFGAHWWADDEMNSKESAQVKRALDYIEATIRWAKAQEKRRSK